MTHVQQPLRWPSRLLVQLTHFCRNILSYYQTTETVFEAHNYSDCSAGSPFSYRSDAISLLIIPAMQ